MKKGTAVYLIAGMNRSGSTWLFNAVRLLTNNPAKVGALARHGIEVAERVAHVFPSNEHNWTYLQTKAKRSGHLF